MIPKSIDEVQWKKAKILLIIGFPLVGIGLITYLLFENFLAILAIIAGFGCFTYCSGIANTMAKFEKYYNDLEKKN